MLSATVNISQVYNFDVTFDDSSHVDFQNLDPHSTIIFIFDLLMTFDEK